MIGLKPLISSNKFLDNYNDPYGYELPPQLDRLRMYLCPERLIGGDGSLPDDSGPSGLQQQRRNPQQSSDESITLNGSQTQKNGSNEDNNFCSCGANDAGMDDEDADDDDEGLKGAAAKKVTLRQFSTPHERESLLIASGGLPHSASCHLSGASGSNGASRRATKKRFGNEYYHSVENVVGDEDQRNNFNHHNQNHNHAVASVLPTTHHTKSSSSASKSPSCRCCPSSISIPSTTPSSLSVIVHPLQSQKSSRLGFVTNDVNCSEINDFLQREGTSIDVGIVGRCGTTGGDKLNIILDETGKPMLVNQCDNRLLLLQTSASLPEMQTLRSLVANGGAMPAPQVHQHRTTVEVHDGRHDVVLSMDNGGDSDCAESGCKGGGSVGCLPKTGRHEDTNV